MQQNIGMLPYVTPETFNCSLGLPGGVDGGGGVAPGDGSSDGDTERSKLCEYLVRASRYIRRVSRRDFLPWVEERDFPIPHRYNDLSMRRMVTAELDMDQDLLEVFELKNADGITLSPSLQYFLLDSNIYPKFAIALKFPTYWTWNQFFGNVKEPVIRVTGMWGYHDEYKWAAWEDTVQVLPVGGIASTDRSVILDSLSDTDFCGSPIFVPQAVYRIDNELITITSTDSDTKTINIARGIRGSTAVSHDAGAKIYRWRVVEDIEQATIQIAKIWREFDASAGGRLGVGDQQTSVELGVPTDAQTIIKMYIRSSF